MKSICSSLVLSALLVSMGCNGSKEQSKSEEKKSTAVGDSEEQVFEEKIRREQESAIKSHGAEGRLIESIASEAQVKIDELEFLDKRLFTIDLQRYFQRPRKVCVRAHVRDIIQNGKDFSVRFHAPFDHLSLDFDLNASESQVLALLTDRPDVIDEYVVVLESSKLIRREIGISTYVRQATGEDDKATAEPYIVDIPMSKVLQGSLIYFKLVRY